jgi:hypothetical protein
LVDGAVGEVEGFAWSAGDDEDVGVGDLVEGVVDVEGESSGIGADGSGVFADGDGVGVGESGEDFVGSDGVEGGEAFVEEDGDLHGMVRSESASVFGG